MTVKAIDQDTFQFYEDDGGEGAATALASVGSNATQDLDTHFRLRVLLQEYNNKPAANQQFSLWYSVNGGTYAQATTATADLRILGSYNTTWTLTDEDATTQQIGSGTFRTGAFSDDNVAGENDQIDLSGNDETEIEFCLEASSTWLSASDYIDFEVRYSGGSQLESYTLRPRITLTGVAIVQGSATIGGAGAMSGTGLLRVLGAASIGGSGALSATALLQILAAASMGGSGGLTATGQILANIIEGSASIGGAGGLSATAILQILAQASIGGSGDLSAQALKVIMGQASVGASGGLSAEGLLLIPGQATLSGTGGLSGAAFLLIPAGATIGGTGGLTATGEIVVAGVVTGSATIGGTGGLSATGLKLIMATGTIGGVGDLSAQALKLIPGQASIGGSGALSAQALLIIVAAASMGGLGGLSATGQIVGINIIEGSATIGGAGGLSVKGHVLWASPSGRVVVVGARLGQVLAGDDRVIDVGASQRHGGGQ